MQQSIIEKKIKKSEIRHQIWISPIFIAAAEYMICRTNAIVVIIIIIITNNININDSKNNPDSYWHTLPYNKGYKCIY